MLQITSGFIASKLMFINKNTIDEVSDGKLVVEIDIVGKKSETGCFTLGAMLAFVELR